MFHVHWNWDAFLVPIVTFAALVVGTFLKVSLTLKTATEVANTVAPPNMEDGETSDQVSSASWSVDEASRRIFQYMSLDADRIQLLITFATVPPAAVVVLDVSKNVSVFVLTIWGLFLLIITAVSFAMTPRYNAIRGQHVITKLSLVTAIALLITAVLGGLFA